MIDQLPSDLLVDLISRVGPMVVRVNSVIHRTYLDNRAIIHARWMMDGRVVVPTTIEELQALDGKYTIPLYPIGARLLASDRDDVIRYALEHDLLEVSSTILIRLIGRPDLMALVKSTAVSTPVASTLYIEHCEIPIRQIREQVYAVTQSGINTLNAIDQLVELIRTRDGSECMGVVVNNLDSSTSWLMVALIINARLSDRDIAWFINLLDRVSPLDRRQLITHIPSSRLIDVIRCAIKEKMKWSLNEDEWHVFARLDLDSARRVSTDDNLSPLVKSLYNDVEQPTAIDLSIIAPHYHRLYVEQWPNVEFTGVDNCGVANDYTRRWGQRYDFSYVMTHFNGRYGINPQTPLTAVNVIKTIKLRAKFDWFGMIRSAIDELIDHSPDGSYTSWFNQKYPTVGDGGRELGMHWDGSWLVPDCEIENGVPESLTWTRILLFIIEHTHDYIPLFMEYLNLPRNIFLILRPRLTHRGQPIDDDTLAQLVADQSSNHVFVDDLPGRWPSCSDSGRRSTGRRSTGRRSTGRRSTMVCRHWIHTTNIMGLRFPTHSNPPTTQSFEDFVKSCV